MIPAVAIHMVSLLVCMLLVSLLHHQERSMILVIVLGQAHFTMAYLYQYKVGKIDTAYCYRYILYAIGVLGVYQMCGRPFGMLDVVTSMYFILHFLYDERYLLRKQGSPVQSWLEVLPLCAAYGGYLFRTKGFPMVGLFCLFFAGVLCLTRLLAGIRERHISVESIYLLSITLVFLGALYIRGVSTQYAYIHVVVLAHYANWYLTYFVRWYRLNEWRRLARFTFEVVLINGISVGLFVAYYYHDVSALAYGYTPAAFFLWTWMHYLSTLRVSDKMAWIKTA